MNPIIQEILIKIGLPIICMIAVYFLNMLRNKIKEKNSNTALVIFDHIIEKIVLALNPTINDIKKRNKLKWGRNKLNKKEIEGIKEEAKYRINKCLGDKVKKDLKFAVKNYDSYIDNSIDSKVEELKIRSKEDILRLLKK